MSTVTIDLDPLIAPISEDQPAGTDPRLDESPVSPFRQVKDKRDEARRAEQQAIATGEESNESTLLWRSVRKQGLELIQSQAKDLQIAVYVLESLMRLEGPAGLADGLILCRALVENFWGQLFPSPDEDGIETTLLPLSWLNTEIVTGAMQHWEITQGSSVGPYRIWQHRQAMDLQNLAPEEQQERISRGTVSMDDVERAVIETDVQFFLDLNAALDRSRQQVRALAGALEERAGHDAPSLRRIEEALDECQRALRLVAGDRLVVASEQPEDADAGAPGQAPRSRSGSVDNNMQSRDDAFRALLQIADFFEKLEPQSLIPAEIRKVVRRGRMRPEDLYRDLIMDDSVLERLFRDVGLNPPTEE